MTNTKNTLKPVAKRPENAEKKLTPADFAAMTGLTLPGATPAKKRAKKVNALAEENAARAAAEAARAHAEKVQRELDRFGLTMAAQVTESVRKLLSVGDQLDLTTDEVAWADGQTIGTVDLKANAKKYVALDVPHARNTEVSYFVEDVLDQLGDFFRQLTIVTRAIHVTLPHSDEMDGVEMITSVYWSGYNKKLENFLLNIRFYFDESMKDFSNEELAFVPFQLVNTFYNFLQNTIRFGQFTVKSSHGRLFLPVEAVPFFWMNYQKAMMNEFTKFKASVDNLFAEAEVESQGK